MKTFLHRSCSLVISIFILAGWLMAFPVSAEDDETSENGSMNLDVVFALDASGSMVYSDPNRIALDAFSLFVDLCDDTCAVGYDVYTNTLMDSDEIKSIKDSESLEHMKNKIKSISYDSNGDTDIALGLTQAKKMFDTGENNDYRKRAIILLSDGNTDLPKGPRTVEQSKREMEMTLRDLSEQNIQVYSIGLNSDGSLDKQELENISQTTGGRSYEIDGSEKLTNIISDIFSNISDMNGIDREIKDGSVDIEIKDSSVFYVNVIIRTKLSVEELNPMLILPSGEPVSLVDDEKVKITSTKSYVLIKILYPEVGKWTLHLNSADNSNCNIKQLNFYSVFITQVVPEKAAVRTNVPIEVTISDNNGLLKDNELLSSVKMVAVITSQNGEATIELERAEPGIYKGSFTPGSTGAYSVKTKAVSERFTKESEEADVMVKTSLNDGSELIEDIMAFIGHNLTTIIMAAAAVGVIIVAAVMLRKN